jgi:NhaA family Na+:H+ antiporter
LFYSKDFSLLYFSIAIGIFLLLFILGKKKFYSLPVYLLAGIVMWYCMMQSGIHASIAGVLLAFAIPFHKEDKKNISFRLQHSLHYPVAFIILPIFALANTAIRFPDNIIGSLTSSNSLGIILGLIIGKFIGIFGISFLAVKTKIATLSNDLNWRHILGISLLGGIGFTMSIFITSLAFDDTYILVASKISILVASLCAAVIGLIILKTNKNRQD